MSDNEKKIVLLQTKKSMSWIRNELFGPIQEAARKPNPFTIDPTTCWCNLSELRLCMLIVENKPVGYKSSWCKLDLIERMKTIFDDEDPSCKIFLSDENEVAFDEQRKQLESGSTKRLLFPPKYTARPSLQMLEDKLNEWYNMNISEKNEPIPKGEFGFGGYHLPARRLAQIPPDYAPDVEGEHPLAFMDRRQKEEEKQDEPEDDEAAKCSSTEA
ncbi:Protein CBG14436 [Caenorhabditis briggsae]|uniref:Uncharacterized protein n=2 Tax=Caenorhabditis briggsae TaxID=6238 RepID=A0AAE8ZRU1_CAEBR|nr:Protein CBG14436 [Caenorhabditis briggsae]ULT81545.1 hypothetical protein L3Y34_011487 [Caenorhabditis briggsae]CAP32964.2 Protein CBG14436 [Caenorhabditis briggsae]